MIRAHIIVEGRVQGVGYRANTRRMANQLKLKGWVRNLRDGRVEIIVEGEEEMVERLIQWCHRGPTSAYVSKVSSETSEAQRDFDRFSVKSTL
ncbi:MAG: acylphosphatase [Candidatus Bathyarchaeota archaeon]|nr:acylphosphatase [Candidatus Bathyarchaeota archaeon]